VNCEIHYSIILLAILTLQYHSTSTYISLDVSFTQVVRKIKLDIPVSLSQLYDFTASKNSSWVAT